MSDFERERWWVDAGTWIGAVAAVSVVLSALRGLKR